MNINKYSYCYKNITLTITALKMKKELRKDVKKKGKKAGSEGRKSSEG